ncbi:hypothetical protein [Haloarcula sp. JP-L23]|uniref:hypothetical protein n=1 Tax=Haloarcula sp. JP-L23 TaxID=2716717 RepID=UPI00140EDCE9|nr:hypothetical protein G9465_25010 [Haloarcula sp. JP-L23]
MSPQASLGEFEDTGANDDRIPCPFGCNASIKRGNRHAHVGECPALADARQDTRGGAE